MSDFDDDITPSLAADFTHAKERELPNSPHVIFDIETSPAWHPGDSVDAAKAYCQPLGIDYDHASIGEHPGVFDADSVKIGNLKDAKKIEAKVAEARDRHIHSVTLHESKAIGGEQSFWESIIDNAALSPVTGRVLAIGYYGQSNPGIDICTGDDDENPELNLLACFWQVFDDVRSESNKMIGWNIANFDVPFLVWRSAKLGIEIPRGVYRGKWLSDSFVDLMNYWPSMYSPWKGKSAWLGAKDAARFLGCSRPVGEIEGKDFWRYFLGSDDERKKSIRYLENDVTEETVIAKALGVI